MLNLDLSSILVVLEMGCALVSVLLAVMCAAVLASHIAPMDPSESEPARRHDTYMRTQARLVEVRRARQALLQRCERASGHEVTIPVNVASIPRDESTRKIHTAPVAVAPVVYVGIAQAPVVVQRVRTIAPTPTIADTIVRALTLSHLHRRVSA